MNKRIIFILTLFIFLSSFVFADGVCELDKYDYHPGENSVFNCGCSSPIEENRDGYFVWYESDGTFIKSEITNSGSCRTSNFGSQHLFNFGHTNYTGNVTFSLNADGTGTPTNWAGVGDIITDYFNVSGSDETTCIIKPSINTNMSIATINLNNWGTFQIQVFDGISNYTLTHASCVATLQNSITGKIIYQEPLRSTNYLEKHITTGSFGYGYFEHFFIESDFTPNTLYNIIINCHCINGSDETCYYGDGGLGVASGFKECEAKFLMKTGEDLRTTNPITYIIVFGSVLVMIAAMLYGGSKSKNEHIKGVLTYISFGCIPLLLQLSKTIMELNNGNPRIISIIWVFEWVSMIVFLFLLIFLLIQFMINVLEKLKNGKG